jgi:FkbM family methyltransferase
MIELDNWITVDGDISLKTAKRRGDDVIENYQKEEIDRSIVHCKKKRIAIDIGSHLGIISYQLSQQFQQVHSFEISPEIYNCSVENLKRQQVSNVVLHNHGLGNTVEYVDLDIPGKTLGTHISPNSKGKYEVRTLDEYNLNCVDFIKIDVEGYEAKVIQGAMETIKRCKPVILYERKGHSLKYGYGNDAPFDMLRSIGYRKIEDIGEAKKNRIIGVR